MNLREVMPADNLILASIIRGVFEEFDAPRQGTVYSDPTTDRLYDLFRKERSVLWVSEEGDRIFGCCGIYPTEGLPAHCAELAKFYLHREARGRGMGKALLAKCISSARALGYRQLYLESLPVFSNALGMYEKLGFRSLDRPLGRSGHTGCTIWMVLDLVD